MRIYVCEDSLDGIFSAVYDAWIDRRHSEDVMVQIQGYENMRTFSQYFTSVSEHEKAEKVIRTLREKMYPEDFEAIYRAALSDDHERADSVFQVCFYALTGKVRRPVTGDLQNPAVSHVFKLARNVWNEAHRYLGFLRFRELYGEVLFAEIHPKNNVLPLIGDHFSNRFPRERFLIYDASHTVFLMHEKEKSWFLLHLEQPKILLDNLKNATENEGIMAECWQVFCDTIAISERKNHRLQQQLLPLKFRAYMTEKYRK